MTDSGVSRRITNMLLEWLGGRNRKSFLIGCTNFLENMDTAFIRSGNLHFSCVDKLSFVLGCIICLQRFPKENVAT